jgi:hypothetical protein
MGMRTVLRFFRKIDTLTLDWTNLTDHSTFESMSVEQCNMEVAAIAAELEAHEIRNFNIYSIGRPYRVFESGKHFAHAFMRHVARYPEKWRDRLRHVIFRGVTRTDDETDAAIMSDTRHEIEKFITGPEKRIAIDELEIFTNGPREDLRELALLVFNPARPMIMTVSPDYDMWM